MAALEAPGDTLCATLCHVAEADLDHALQMTTLDGKLLGPIPRAKLVGFLRSIFFAFNFTVPGLGAPVPVAPPSAPPAPQSQPPAQPQNQPTADPEEVLVPLCEYVDQASRGHAKPLTYAELALARRTYVEAAGCDPCEEHTPTAEQLAGLRAILKANRVPYVDFAVWGPFGSRLSRFRKTDASVFVGNTLVTKRVEGPVGFEAWAASWDLFAVAMVSLGAARLGTLAKYRAGIVQLTRLFPRLWSVLHTSETIVRTERWSRLREQIEGLVAMGGQPAGYDPSRPWDAVIAASAYAGPLGLNASWWQAHLVLPCTLSNSAGGATSMIRDVEGSTSHGTLPGSSTDGNSSRPKAAQQQRQPPAAHKESSKSSGSDICQNWNNKKGGCEGDGPCGHGRRHVCSICGGAHRAVDHDYSKGGRKKRWNNGGSGNGQKKQR